MPIIPWMKTHEAASSGPKASDEITERSPMGVMGRPYSFGADQPEVVTAEVVCIRDEFMVAGLATGFLVSGSGTGTIQGVTVTASVQDVNAADASISTPTSSATGEC